MPYRKFKKGGKFCMENTDTGKSYCYDSETAREKGMRMHEAFKHGWKPTRKSFLAKYKERKRAK